MLIIKNRINKLFSTLNNGFLKTLILTLCTLMYHCALVSKKEIEGLIFAFMFAFVILCVHLETVVAVHEAVHEDHSLARYKM